MKVKFHGKDFQSASVWRRRWVYWATSSRCWSSSGGPASAPPSPIRLPQLRIKDQLTSVVSAQIGVLVGDLVSLLLSIQYAVSLEGE